MIRKDRCFHTFFWLQISGQIWRLKLSLFWCVMVFFVVYDRFFANLFIFWVELSQNHKNKSLESTSQANAFFLCLQVTNPNSNRDSKKLWVNELCETHTLTSSISFNFYFILFLSAAMFSLLNLTLVFFSTFWYFVQRFTIIFSFNHKKKSSLSQFTIFWFSKSYKKFQCVLNFCVVSCVYFILSALLCSASWSYFFFCCFTSLPFRFM